jgi:hypothetical protein
VDGANWELDAARYARQGAVVDKAQTGKAVRMKDFCLAISARRGC